MKLRVYMHVSYVRVCARSECVRDVRVCVYSIDKDIWDYTERKR